MYLHSGVRNLGLTSEYVRELATLTVIGISNTHNLEELRAGMVQKDGVFRVGSQNLAHEIESGVEMT